MLQRNIRGRERHEVYEHLKDILNESDFKKLGLSSKGIHSDFLEQKASQSLSTETSSESRLQNENLH